MPIGGGTGPTVYRKSWVKEAGYDKHPERLEGFLTLCQKLQKNGHPAGFSLGHALGDANGYREWLLWSHNAYVVDENGKIALNSKATIDGAEICDRTAEDDDPRHAVLERRRQQPGFRSRPDRPDVQWRLDLLRR